MKIELCEDNGFLNGGKPTLVVLVIDGKHRIPYEATKTIQELYADVAKVCDIDATLQLETALSPLYLSNEIKPTTTGKFDLTEIQKEDIVKCIKVHPREEGADCDLEIGDEYRVLSITKDRGQATSYDIVDDNSPTPYRIRCIADEIELSRKRKIKTNPVKKNYVDKAWEKEFKLAESAK